MGCNSDGSGTVQFTSFGTSNYTGSPRWSPNGRLIAFSSNVGGKPTAYVISVEGGKPEPPPIDDLSSWSRDGNWVYFSSRTSGENQLWKMPWPFHSENGTKQTIAKIPHEPAWGFSVSPDGRSLLFSEFEAVKADLMLAENFR